MTLVLSGTDGLSDVDGSAATPAIRGSDTNTGMFFPAADTIAFSEGGVESMRLDSAGNLGLGVTPGTYTNSTIVLENGGGLNSQQDYLNIGANWTYDAPNYRYISSGPRATWYQQGAGAHAWFTAPSGTAGNAITWTQVMFTDANGNFAIPPSFNHTTASAANVFIRSDGYLQRSTSSLKYKTDVQDAEHGLADVLKLRSVTYKGKNDGETVFGGLIAEEVHAAGLTEFVQYAEDGSPDALAYGNMVSLLTKAIQELKAEVDALKAQLGAQA